MNSTSQTVQVGLVRTMPHFSMDVYAEGLISGFRTRQPDWKIVELRPKAVDRRSRSVSVRATKAHERFWNFPKRVQQQSADIYHIVDHSDAHIVRWIKKKNKPVVVTCHDLINYFYPQNLQGSVRLPFISDRLWRSAVEAMQLADTIIAVSSTTAKDVGKLLNVESNRVVVVPNAVDPAFTPASTEEIQAFRQQLNVPPRTFCCLNVGSNHPRKNVSAILQAIYLLKQQNVPVQFWKISGTFNPDQEAFIQEHDLSNDIRRLDNVDDTTLRQAYSAADVLVAPSFHEGFGLTLLEAMACGTPVLTSNVSAMPEVAGEAGLLVNPNATQEIADCLQRLYKDPSLQQQLSIKGLERTQRFSWDNAAGDIAEIYKELLKK